MEKRNINRDSLDAGIPVFYMHLKAFDITAFNFVFFFLFSIFASYCFPFHLQSHCSLVHTAFYFLKATSRTIKNNVVIWRHGSIDLASLASLALSLYFSFLILLKMDIYLHNHSIYRYSWNGY